MSAGQIFLVPTKSKGGDKKDPFIEKQPIGFTMRTKILVESTIFKLFYLVSDQENKILKAIRTLSGFDIFEYENDKLICRLKANIFGTKYSLSYHNDMEIIYETSFLERGKPRTFKIKINELELMNKKPLFNTETNSFSLNFSGRVTMPSVKNFQIIHQLDPTYITLTFGKEDSNSYILDFTYPWSVLDAFCVGLSSLDHKFGSD